MKNILYKNTRRNPTILFNNIRKFADLYNENKKNKKNKIIEEEGWGGGENNKNNLILLLIINYCFIKKSFYLNIYYIIINIYVRITKII